MTFLMTLSVKLLSMLILSLTTRSVITNPSSDLLISLLEKFDLFYFDRFNNSGVITVEMYGSASEEKSSSKML